MAVVNHGIAQCIVLVAKFENGALEFRAFGETYAFCKRTRRNVADNNLKRNDADGFDRRFPVGKLFDKMSRNAFFFKHFHEIVRNAVVDNALARDCALLFAVKCGCIVLIVNDINTFDIGCVNLLCLAFVELLSLFHFCSSFSVSVCLVCYFCCLRFAVRFRGRSGTVF